MAALLRATRTNTQFATIKNILLNSIHMVYLFFYLRIYVINRISMSPVSEPTTERHIIHRDVIDDDLEARVRRINDIPVHGEDPRPEAQKIIDQCIAVAQERYAAENYTGLEGVGRYREHSDFFFLRNSKERIVITSSLIRVPKNETERRDFRFPFEIEAEEYLYPGIAEKIAQVRELAPDTVVEVSSLARKKDSRTEDSDESGNAKALDLYREMWQYSRAPDIDNMEKGSKHEIWVALIEKGLDSNLIFAFGEQAVEQVGETFEYEGGTTTPYVIHLDKCVKGMVDQYKSYAKEGEEGESSAQKFFKGAIMDYLIDGLDPSCLNDQEKSLLEEVGYEFD